MGEPYILYDPAGRRGTSVILGQFAYNEQGLEPGRSAGEQRRPELRRARPAGEHHRRLYRRHGQRHRGLAYNPASQITQRTRSNDIYAWTGHYAVNRAYTADGLNRYTAAGGASFAYDLNGNLISDGSRTYTYDVENRLVAASGPSVALRYDPLGRLYETIGPSGTTQFLYDGDALVGEYLNTPHTMTRRYVHGANAGADDPLIWYDPTVLHYLHADHQGSIVAAANNAGTVVAINAYDEYGIPASTNIGRFQYTGQIWLPELGMYHYKARVYSPTLGRMMQTDPIGYEDQFNLYAYVGNDPVNAVDPTGESGCGTRIAGADSPACSGGTLIDHMASDQQGHSQRPPHGPRTYTSGYQSGGGDPVAGLINDGQEIASNARSQAAAQMRETRGRGRTGEEVARQALIAGGFRILGEQVHIRDVEGNLRIVDFIVEGGPNRMLGVEVKYGGNMRNLRQRTIDTRIRLQGGRVVSRNIFDLRYGRRVQFRTIEMNARLVPSP